MPAARVAGVTAGFVLLVTSASTAATICAEVAVLILMVAALVGLSTASSVLTSAWLSVSPMASSAASSVEAE
jgi:hypothetical protein